MVQHSQNFLFWKTAFENKNISILELAKMTGINGEITKDEFQEITNMDFIPDVSTSKIKFISTSEIMQELAINKINSMQKDKKINDLASQMALSKISDMQKDRIINNLTKQIASNKLELIQLKNKNI